MSAVDGSERKRKPSDLSLENSPLLKQVKTEGGTMSASSPNNMLPRSALQHLVSLQPSMNDEQKTKYMTGLDQLRSLVEKNGPGTPEGQSAQNRYDQIVGRLRLNLRQQQVQQQQAQQKQREVQQQQQAQQQQTHQPQQQNYNALAGGSLVSVAGGNGTTIGGGASVGGAVGSGPATTGAPAAPSISQRQTWIVPLGVAPQDADAWRADIYNKLSQVGQKMNHAKTQINGLHQNLQRPNLTPEERAIAQQKIADVTQNFNGLREILNKFTTQQKILQQQQQQNQMRASQQQQQGQVSMVGGGQMQKPAPQGIVPEIQQGQQGMMNIGVPQQQTNPNNTQGSPPNLHQQPAQQPNQMQQHTQQHMQPQTQQQQHQSAPAQRIATPIQRADSPPGASTSVAGINQNRVVVGRQTMSPTAQQPPIQQQPQQMMGQTSTIQQQATQQPPQQTTQQVSTAAQRGLHQQAQQPGTAAGRSPASGPAGPPGTPIAQPNSPAPRPGSVQPAARPPTATGTPVAQQQPQTQQIQQAHRIPPASSASAASPTTSVHPSQTTRDTPQGRPFPIPPNLAVAAPQPIAVPAARPTLSGGMNSSGNQMMSTPAITKQPAFEFDEGGMGLLSKRKLEELVKQIDPEEKLDPDVEEAVLELVDEFIDSIATSACKMAKLRGSDTLDLKDVQIILERNWNIRIPGYAADEIRTVRKFHPAPGYHHKMAALSAQKQLAQTSGKGGE